MKRFLSNFAILLLLTVAITAVLASLADAPRSGDDGSSDAAAIDPAPTATDTTEPSAESTASAVTEADKPDHLQEPAATATATEVAGVVAQASDSLPNTGPIELLQWMIIGAGIVATGGMVSGAARDWAHGDLTLL